LKLFENFIKCVSTKIIDFLKLSKDIIGDIILYFNNSYSAYFTTTNICLFAYLLLFVYCISQHAQQINGLRKNIAILEMNLMSETNKVCFNQDRHDETINGHIHHDTVNHDNVKDHGQKPNHRHHESVNNHRQHGQKPNHRQHGQKPNHRQHGQKPNHRHHRKTPNHRHHDNRREHRKGTTL
jgi:hypothetical protein